MQIALTIIGIIAASALSFWLGRVSAKWHQMEQRLAKLEELQPKRLTHTMAAGLEDAIAIIMRKQRERDLAQLHAKQAVEKAFADQEADDRLYKILRELRSDPTNYDMETPNGRK